MAIRTELSLRLQNSPGALSRICQLFSEVRINSLALTVEAGGIFRTVVDNHVLAAGTLREQHYEVTERDVLYIEIPNNPGAFTRVLRLLSASGVNLEYVYGSAIEDQSTTAVVVGVEDIQRAAAAAGV